ncbi:MAG TPA: hypothetical protein VG435_00145 [Acidimicrobiales bacterium]|jgi:hypothetical protein|nr:hypothetical protein [Acidimicrobiales bacterium]
MTAPESVEQAAARLEEMAPGYLATVRWRAAEMGVPRTRTERVRRSIGLVAEYAYINPDAPTDSSRLVGRVVKRVVGSVTRFYILRIVHQVTDLGESASWMGQALCDYVGSLEAEVDDLRERVRRLEERSGAS